MRFTVTEDSRPQYEAFLTERGQLINDCLAFVEEARQGVPKNFKPGSAGDIAVLRLASHLMESIDGVCILVSNGSVQPCEPLLRSALEAFLGIEYVLETDNDQRGLQFLVGDVHRQINFYRKCDPDDELRKSIRKNVSEQAFDGILGRLPIDEVRKKIARLKADLECPELKPIEEEWQRTKAGGNSAQNPGGPCPTCGMSKPIKRGTAHWYSLFDGPKNLELLAKHLKRTDLYELLYRPWSTSAHAEDATRNIHDIQDALQFGPVRSPDGITNIPRFVALLTLPLALRLIGNYGPETNEAAKKRHGEICQKIRKAEEIRISPWR